MNLTRMSVFATVALVIMCGESLRGGQAPPRAVEPDDRPASSSAASERVRLGLRGVYFVPNHGQWGDEEVIYGFKSRGLDVAFRESAFTMHIARAANESNETTDASPKRERGGVGGASHEAFLADASGSLRESADFDRLTLTITFPGSNAVLPIGGDPRAAKFNYYVGGEGRGTASNVPSFGAIIYENLYDGIDLHVTGNDDGVLKYEFHCAPGADYTQISIHYDGIDSLCVNAGGDLEIVTGFGTLRDGAPIVWQEEDISTSRARQEEGIDTSIAHEHPLLYRRGSSDQTIPARFHLLDRHTYTIRLNTMYDPSRPLVIDPEVEWMSYFGGSDRDTGYQVALDGGGGLYLCGTTMSTDFEGRNNNHHGGHELDVFVLKASDKGSLAWMTYLGGSAYDNTFGIAVDGAGNILIAGNTVSTDFEGRTNEHHGGLDDAYVLKMNPAGAILWMLYIGGTHTDYGFGLTVDAAGDAYMAGRSRSIDVEGRTNAHHGGVHDGLVARVSAAGALQWATYVGGSGAEPAIGIDLDSAGHILTSGYTDSTNFEGRTNTFRGGASDAFVARLTPAGAIDWARYLGGSGRDEAFDIAVNGSNESFVAAYTESTDFEGRNNAYQFEDGALIKVNPAGSVQWMTYLGGTDNDSGVAVALIPTGAAVVVGYTQSADFVGRTNEYRGQQDAFLAVVSDGGGLQSAMFAGGSDSEDGAGVVLDAAGRAYLSGTTASPDFGGRMNEYHGARDVFLARISISDRLQITITATCPSGGPIRIEWSGATPGGQVTLIFARNTGSFIIPNNLPCAGTTLGLGSNQIQLAWQGGAGADGSRTLNATTGPGACGGYFQLLDLTSCGTSNVARVE